MPDLGPHGAVVVADMMFGDRDLMRPKTKLIVSEGVRMGIGGTLILVILFALSLIVAALKQ